MRFYGLGFVELHAMPIRAFWLLNGMIDRIRAEETLEILPAHTVAMGGNHVGAIVEALHGRIGRPQVVETVRSSDHDIAAARRLFGDGGDP